MSKHNLLRTLTGQVKEQRNQLLFISIPNSQGATHSFSFADLRMVSGSGSE